MRTCISNCNIFLYSTVSHYYFLNILFSAHENITAYKNNILNQILFQKDPINSGASSHTIIITCMLDIVIHSCSGHMFSYFI